MTAEISRRNFYQAISPDTLAGRGVDSIEKRVSQWLAQATNIKNGLGKVWSALSGRSPRLLNLADVESNCLIQGSSYLGIQSVSINQIRGSASLGRCNDFDANFRPLKAHNKDRLARVATARQQGLRLPPVALIQIENIFFVEDGHHRISVAQQLGDEEIEAQVTVWHAAGPLPWPQPGAASA